jgi:hypothetical protein
VLGAPRSTAQPTRNTPQPRAFRGTDAKEFPILNIGTHAKKIQTHLRGLFTDLGWTPRYDVGLGRMVNFRLDRLGARSVTFGDGVQVWENPALT